jgi:hypothetical protein
MGIFEKLQARTFLPQPSMSELWLTLCCRPRALPPRATLHTPRETHNLHQRRAIRRWRIRLHLKPQLSQIKLNGRQQQQQAVQQNANNWHQGAEGLEKRWYWKVLDGSRPRLSVGV